MWAVALCYVSYKLLIEKELSHGAALDRFPGVPRFPLLGSAALLSPKKKRINTDV